MDSARIVGPFKPTKQAALEAWREKWHRLNSQPPPAPEPDLADTVGGTIYYCLFGVYSWEGEGRPPQSGPWAHELAETSYQTAIDNFRAHIRSDPIATLDPARVTIEDLEAFRSRLMAKPRRNLKKAREGQAAELKTLNARTVDKIMQPVFKALKRHGNMRYRELAPLKKLPPKKGWMSRRDREEFLELMPSETVRRATLMMLNGMSIGEVCAATADVFDGECLQVKTQVSEIAGHARHRGQLKRPRRFRFVPASEDLKADLAGATGKLVDIRPSNLRRAIRNATQGTKFEGLTPHDLRRSAGKWMLDRGAKLSDVAAILGNDPKTLLLWYDTADAQGMAAAVKMAL